jgi:hypothetical protein
LALGPNGQKTEELGETAGEGLSERGNPFRGWSKDGSYTDAESWKYRYQLSCKEEKKHI